MHIAIVGGGFLGTLTAAHLCALPAFAAGDLKVTLFERRAQAGRGIAYSTPYPEHVLNVVAGNMSAWADQPEHLVTWLAAQAPQSGDAKGLRHSFVPRPVFGHYLESILQEAVSRGLRQVQGEVQGLALAPSGAQLELAEGQSLHADRVALCLGHFDPALPRVPGGETLVAPQLIANPWEWRSTEAIGRDADVVILGTGLTMVDTVLSLVNRGFRGTITAVSRHGLIPQPHVLGLPAVAMPALMGARPKDMLQHLRQSVDRHAADGGNWRQCIDALRGSTAALWQSLTPGQQGQILRHAKSYWDVHRHRIAPHVADLLKKLQQAGQLRILGGRLTQIAQNHGDLRVVVRRRDDASFLPLQAQHLVNCTGGHNNWQRCALPLVKNLLSQNLAVANRHGLGVQAHAEGRLIDGHGRPASCLFVGGPALVGRDFESVAVPELRVQAAQLARQLAASEREPRMRS